MPMVAEGLQELARAKVNLTLHVTGRRADGYHMLDSLVVFPNVGDLLEAEPSHGLSLTLAGRFAGDLDAGGANSVIKAAESLRGPGAALHLTKNLPVASGIGGGSADAAAALRLLAALWNKPLPDDQGLALGADVPVCLRSTSQRMSGIGEVLSDAPDLPEMGIVLVNSGVSVSTAGVFQALTKRDNPGMEMPQNWTGFAEFAAWLKGQRNDLQAAALTVDPGIAAVLDALENTGAALSRMSGSGGTCFGLYPNLDAAVKAARELQKIKPEWWTTAAAF